MRNAISRFIGTGLLLACTAPVHAAPATISGYDVFNAWPSGAFGPGWSHAYSGTITPNGDGTVNYTGSTGSLSDGVISSYAGTELFLTVPNPTIVLHLASAQTINSISIFGGDLQPLNAVPGTLTGMTITINGISAALTSTEFGSLNLGQPGIASVPVNDLFTLTGTPLAGLATNTVTLSNFVSPYAGPNSGNYFSITEIAVDVASPVPESDTKVLFVAGLLLLGAFRRRFT